MKLSKAQAEVLEEAKRKIDEARQYETYEEYYVKSEPEWRRKDPEEYKTKHPDVWEYYKKNWENRRNGIVLTQCNSRTIRKLEKLGLIEIIEDSCGQYVGVDTIKVLNY